MEKIKKVMLEELSNLEDLKNLSDLKVKYLGKKGIITELYGKMKEISNDEKKEYGKRINELKNLFSEKYEELKSKLENEALTKKLEEEAIDVTLPGMKIENGAPHMLDKVIEQVEDFYISMGFDVVEGP